MDDSHILVPVAYQGKMRMQLTQAMRVCDIRLYFDGPVKVVWEDDQSGCRNWMPASTTTQRIGRK